MPDKNKEINIRKDKHCYICGVKLENVFIYKFDLYFCSQNCLEVYKYDSNRMF
jgi:predicted nucleic acid-binding Zn ribbon protein